MKATPFGTQLRRPLEQALQLIDAATQQHVYAPAKDTAHVSIMMADSIAWALFPPVAHVVRKEAPGMRFSVQPIESLTAYEQLREGESDLLIGYFLDMGDSFHASALFKQRLCCIASISHPIIQGKISAKQLCEFPSVYFGREGHINSTTESIIDAKLSTLGLRRMVGVRVPQTLVTPKIVAATDMVAVVPVRIASQMAETRTLQVLPLPFSIKMPEIVMIWHERLQEDPAHKWLRQRIREVAKELPD